MGQHRGVISNIIFLETRPLYVFLSNCHKCFHVYFFYRVVLCIFATRWRRMDHNHVVWTTKDLLISHFTLLNYDKNISFKRMYFCSWVFLILLKRSEPFLTVLQHCVMFSQDQEFLRLKHTIMEKNPVYNRHQRECKIQQFINSFEVCMCISPSHMSVDRFALNLKCHQSSKGSLLTSPDAFVIDL